MLSILVGLLACAAAAGEAPSEGEPEVEMIFTRERTFRVPLDLSDEDQKKVKAVRLFVSNDEGKTWRRYREESPRRPTVTFRADADGVYWLAIGLIGQDQVMTPRDPAELRAGVKVTVDTTKPEVMLEALKSKSGLRGVRWTISDAAPLDLMTIRLALWDENIGQWKPRDAAKTKNRIAWFDAKEKISKAQVFVRDPAGNETVVQAEIEGDRFHNTAQPTFALADGAPTPEEFAKDAAQPAKTAEQPAQRSRTEPKPTSHAVEETKPAPTRPGRHAASAPEPEKPRGDDRAAVEAEKPLAPVSLDAESPKTNRRNLPETEAEPVAGRKSQDDGAASDVEQPKTPPAKAPAEVEPEASEAPPVHTRKRRPPKPVPDETVDEAASAKSPAEAKKPAVDDPDHPPAPPAPPKKAPTAEIVKEDPAPETTYSNRKTLILHYELEGGTGETVEDVELWGSRDQGKTWTRIGSDPDGRSPMEATFPEEGLWGIRLAVRTKGKDLTPKPGAAASAYVEIDTTPPTVSTPFAKFDRSAIKIRWSSKDKNPAADSARLSYALDAQGPWENVASQLKPSGDFTWRPDQEIMNQPLYFRIQVRDKAGNVAFAASRKPLARDSDPPASRKVRGEKALRSVSGGQEDGDPPPRRRKIVDE